MRTIIAKNRFKKLRKSFGYSINLDTFVLGQTKVLFVVYLLSSFYIQQAVALGKAAAYQFVRRQTDRSPKPSTPSPYGTAPEGHGERIPRPPSVASLRSGHFDRLSDPKRSRRNFCRTFFAERTRFELVIRLPVCRFSKPVDSATLPPLRMFWPNGCQTFRRYLDYKDTNFSCFPRILRKINAEVSMSRPRNPPRSDARDAGRRQDRTEDPAGSTA